MTSSERAPGGRCRRARPLNRACQPGSQPPLRAGKDLRRRRADPRRTPARRIQVVPAVSEPSAHRRDLPALGWSTPLGHRSAVVEAHRHVRPTRRWPCSRSTNPRSPTGPLPPRRPGHDPQRAPAQPTDVALVGPNLSVRRRRSTPLHPAPRSRPGPRRAPAWPPDVPSVMRSSSGRFGARSGLSPQRSERSAHRDHLCRAEAQHRALPAERPAPPRCSAFGEGALTRSIAHSNLGSLCALGASGLDGRASRRCDHTVGVPTARRLLAGGETITAERCRHRRTGRSSSRVKPRSVIARPAPRTRRTSSAGSRKT